MTEQELREILASCESDRIEFTISTRDTDKFSQAVCAFANDLPNSKKPGYLVLGVSDSQEIKGIQATDELLRSLAGLRDDGNIQPLPSIAVERVGTPEGDVAVVTVQPSSLPPVRYRGRAWIRLGPRKGIASIEDERILTEKRVSHAVTFDAEPCLDSKLEDLALPIFQLEYQPRVIDREVLEENHRSIEDQLASLRFFDPRNGTPTHAGVVLFGIESLRFLPGAYIQFLRIDGDNLSDDVTQDRVLSGDLLTVLRELDALIEAHVAQEPSAVSPLREEMVATYPIVAIREILMNAVMHRNYSSTAPLRFYWFRDRIEIHSPGGLYGEATAENFPKQTSYRNPIVAEALKALGYVNRYGRGIIRAREAMATNGNPAPEFHFEPNSVLVILRKVA